MVMHVCCVFCGMRLDNNENATGLTYPDGLVVTMCSIHHEVACRVKEQYGEVNWCALSAASLVVVQERPHWRDVEKWIRRDPVKRLLELYPQFEADPNNREAFAAQQARAGSKSPG